MSRNPQSFMASNFTFNAGTIEAAKEFAKSKPYRGTIPNRREKLKAFHAQLCKANEVDLDLIFMGNNSPRENSGRSSLTRGDTRLGIVLVGRLSIITYLFLFGAYLSTGNRDKAQRWSLNLFQRSFPKSFKKLKFNRVGLVQSVS